MELHFLQEFIVLERIRNFTRAADALYTTEATLSRHIKHLEKELKQPLFIRTTRSIELTEFGEKFLVYAKRVAAIMEQCNAELLQKYKKDSYRLMIGVFGAGTNYKPIHDALDALAARYPEYVVGMVQSDSNEQKERLNNREYDLAIARERACSFEDKYARITILKEPLCVVLSKNDPLSAGETVEIQALENRTVSFPSEHMLAHRLFVERCRGYGFEPIVTSLLKEREFIQNFRISRIGSGITVLCAEMAERFSSPASQVIRELSPPIYEYINLLTLKAAPYSEPVQNAIRCFEEAIEGNQP